MLITQEVFAEMEKHALTNQHREVCGFVYEDRYVPLANLAVDSFSFFADPVQIASALARYGEPIAIFHTHPNGSAEPSLADIKQSYYYNSTMLIGKIVNGRLELSTSFRW